MTGAPTEDGARIAEGLAAIGDNKAFLEGLFTYIPVPLQVVSADGHSLLVNQAFRDLFGSEPPPDYNMMEDDVAERVGVLDMVRRSFRGETVHTPTFWYDPRDLTRVTVSGGRRVAISMTTFPLLDRDGRVRYVICTFRDETAEVWARERIEAERDRFRALFEYATDGIVVLDEEGRFVEANPAASAILGLPASDLRQRRYGDFSISGEDAAARWKRVRATGHLQGEERIRRADGSLLDLELSAVRFTPGHSLALIRDVSERKRLEAALRSANAQLEARVEDLVRSNLDLQQFAYIASHDLQAPLRTIGGFVQLLRQRYESQLDAQANDWIERTVQGTERLRALIEGLLDYSRAGSQGQPFEAVDLGETFRHAVADLDALVAESGAEVTCDPLPTVVGDAAQLARVLQNLIVNAIKYRRDAPPRVHVAAERGQGEWVVAVRDNGIGVAAEDRERIFGLFRRLHDQRQVPGTGIGLAVCRRVVLRHGGRIWVESEPGAGSVFRFTIPDPRDAARI